MYKRSFWLVLVLLLGGGIWWLQATPPPATPEDPGPTISWSVPTLTGTMFPGTSSTTIVSFRSNEALSGVVVDLTPSLGGVLTVNPKSFASIVANQSYQLTLTLTAPPEFKKREFGGTIHIRNDGKPPRTYAKPLEVELRTDWNTFRNEIGAFSFALPFAWVAWPEEHGDLTVSNVLPETQSNPESLQGICEVTFHKIPKSPGITLQNWLLAVEAEAGYPSPISLSVIHLGSLNGLRELSGEMILTDTVYLSVSDSTVLSAGLICGSDLRPQGQMIFSSILSSMSVW